MIYELIYTSAPAGLRPGSSGYCTVQSSRGIPAPTVDLLESLSGYRHVFTAGTPEAAKNPVNYGHYILRLQGRPEHVLSRVSDCPLDHTGRSNKLGHHMVIDTPDAVPAGPAWLLQKPGWMTDKWDGQVTVLNSVRSAPSTPRAAGKCEAWRRTAGDAGWAGVLAESFLTDPQRKVFLIYQPGTDILALFEEAIALLPFSQRWDVTFSTYGAALPATVECLWNGVIAGSQEEHLSKRFVNALRIDLTKALGAAPEMGKLVTFARTGKKVDVAAPTAISETPATMSLSEDDLADDRTSLKSPQRSPAGSVPSTPPPVRRRAKQSDAGLGRLVLIVFACCLLFGGGTAASLVYFMKQSQGDIEVVDSVNAAEAEVPPELDVALPPDAAVDAEEAPSDAGHGEPSTNAQQDRKPLQAPPVASDNGHSRDAKGDKKPVPAKKPNPPKPINRTVYAKIPLYVEHGQTTVVQLEDGWNKGLTNAAKPTLYFPLLKDVQDERALFGVTSKRENDSIVLELLDAFQTVVVAVTINLDDDLPQVSIRCPGNPIPDQEISVIGAVVALREGHRVLRIALNSPIAVPSMEFTNDLVRTPISPDDPRLRLLAAIDPSQITFKSNRMVVVSKEASVNFVSNGTTSFVSESPAVLNGNFKRTFLVGKESRDGFIQTFTGEFGLDNEIVVLGEVVDKLQDNVGELFRIIEEALETELNPFGHAEKVEMLKPGVFGSGEAMRSKFKEAVDAAKSLIPEEKDIESLSDEKKEHVNLLKTFVSKRVALWDKQMLLEAKKSLRRSMSLTEFSLRYELVPVFGEETLGLSCEFLVVSPESK